MPRKSKSVPTPTTITEPVIDTSAEILDSIMSQYPQNEVSTIAFTVGDQTYSYDVKSCLSIDEYTAFINRVCDTVCADNDYNIAYFEPIFEVTLMQMFVPDMPVYVYEYGLNTQKNYEFCKTVGMREKIENKVSSKYIETLYFDCLNAIEFREQLMVKHTTTLAEDAVMKANETYDALNMLMDSLTEAIKKFDPATIKGILKSVKQVGAKKTKTSTEGFINDFVAAVENSDNVIPLKKD